ncbi:hypothetical protein JCM10207_008815 [Rhodosporidiobolus poonsookiae]
MSGIVDNIKAAVGAGDAAAPFQSGNPVNPTLEKQQQGGEDSRPPGQQHKMQTEIIDDVYADGKPYKGSGKLEGKVLLITGGDSGIGRATAILAAIEGAKGVTLVYLAEEQKDAEDVKQYIAAKAPSTQVLLLPLDLKSESNCVQAVEATVKEFGRLDILFNNAAQQLENQDILTLDSKQWEDTFQINMNSYFYCAKAAIPHLKQNKGANIVNNASVNAFIGRPDLLDYTSTKGAIVSFTRALSNQIVGKTGIRVNAVAPGAIITPLVPATFSTENLGGLDSCPMGRPGQPIEIAAPVIFLASQDASYVTGCTLHANGGMYVH